MVIFTKTTQKRTREGHEWEVLTDQMQKQSLLSSHMSGLATCNGKGVGLTTKSLVREKLA